MALVGGIQVPCCFMEPSSAKSNRSTRPVENGARVPNVSDGLVEAMQWLNAAPGKATPDTILEVLSAQFGIERSALYFRRADQVSWRLAAAVPEAVGTLPAPELVAAREPGRPLFVGFPTQAVTMARLTNDRLIRLIGPDGRGRIGVAIAFDFIDTLDALAILGWSSTQNGTERFFEQIRLFLWMAGQRLAAESQRQSLEADRRFLEVLMNHSPDFVYSKNERGEYTRCNRAFALFLGVEGPTGVVGRTDADFFVPESAEAARLREARLLETGESMERRDERFERIDGKAVWVSTTEVPVFGATGEAEGLLGIARDITERKLSEEALDQRRALLEAALRSVVDAVITVNEEGRVLLMNEVAERLLGLGFSEAYGRPVDACVRLSYDAGGRKPFLPVADVLKGGGRIEALQPVFLQGVEERQLSVLVQAAPMRDQQGQVRGVVLALMDVTRQLKMEREARRAEKLESLGVLAGGIAHDFNNLLTAVLGHITLATQAGGIADSVREPLEVAERVCGRAQALAGQLLTFAKGGEPNKTRLNLARVLEDSLRVSLHGSPVELDFEVPPSVPTVEADETQLRQVFENLVLNARQAMPNGGRLIVKLSVGTVPGVIDAPGEESPVYLRLLFSDNGPGMSLEAQQRVFDPYYTTKKRGTGLGLSICRSILKRHGGGITLESKPGAGAAFTLWLPFAGEGGAAGEPASNLPVPTLLAVPTASSDRSIALPIRERRLLVYDDEPAICEFTRRCCEAIGFEVAMAGDSKTARELFEAARTEGRPIDLVLADLSLPGDIGGDELLRQLRSIDPRVRAILSTGYAEDPVVSAYREHGFCEVLVKPYRVGDLRAAVSKALESLTPDKPSPG